MKPANDLGPERAVTVGEFLDIVNGGLSARKYSVRGEVTGFRPHPTGAYFSLKDAEDAAVMDCYMSPYAYRGIGVPLEDGMEIGVFGAPSVYKPKGRFSFRTESFELFGEGSLKKAYELLKAKLEAEGLFVRKRPLPEIVSRVAVITSRTGAVIDDFRKNLDRRGYAVALYDVRVEGAQSVPQITGALRAVNASAASYDIAVIMRGGGSLEDLQAFNNELVARELFAMKIPTIAGIGHDRDAPIASLVADASVSTPTAAAVLVNRTWDVLREKLPRSGETVLRRCERALEDLALRIDMDPVLRVLEMTFRRVGDALAAHAAYIDGMDPEKNLRLGYSIVIGASGSVIKDAAQVSPGDRVRVRLHRGRMEADVRSTEPS